MKDTKRNESLVIFVSPCVGRLSVVPLTRKLDVVVAALVHQ